MEKRGYQYDFANKGNSMYDVRARERKARTMVAVLGDYFGGRLDNIGLLNLGGSTGVIDNYLSDYFRSVTGVDIDAAAIRHAGDHYKKNNLEFRVGDAMSLEFGDNVFDVVVCSQVYEHVPDVTTMMKEIFRVLKPGGVCYFAANNRLMWNEPHYGLPLLSVLPRPLAHVYIRLAGKADHYHELHLTYWSLRRLVSEFSVHDYTDKIIVDPGKYAADYMVKPDTFKASVAAFITKHVYWLMPGYIWVLEKPR